MMSFPSHLESLVERRRLREPQTVLPAMLVGGGLSLLLWGLLGHLLLALAR